MTDQPLNLDGRAITLEMVEGLEEEYLVTENSLLPWYAYSLCRSNKLPIPPWVEQYLDRVADNLFYLGMSTEPLPNKPASVIAEAIEMKRPGDTLRQARDSSWLPIAVDVQYFKQALDLDETYAIDQAAKKHSVSESTARRAWIKFQAIFKI